MKNLTDINHVLTQVSYKNWQFATGKLGNGFYLQTSNNGNGNNSCLDSSKKRYLSPAITNHEIIQTALLAILAAEDHAIFAQIKYQGKTYDNPTEVTNYQQNLSPIAYSMHDLDF
jgi:hypothetical protein